MPGGTKKHLIKQLNTCIVKLYIDEERVQHIWALFCGRDYM